MGTPCRIPRLARENARSSRSLPLPPAMVGGVELLVLDFDGVISDSAPEAFVVAMRTWCALHPASRLRQPAEPLLDEARVPSSADVAGCSLYAPFLEMMPLGNRATTAEYAGTATSMSRNTTGGPSVSARFPVT